MSVEMVQAIQPEQDPRALMLGHVDAILWRGVVYYRDLMDFISPDTTGTLAPDFPTITLRPGVTVPCGTPEMCIVSADGWRFKPAVQ